MKHLYVIAAVAAWQATPEAGNDFAEALRDAVQGAVGAALCVAVRPKSVREGLTRVFAGVAAAWLFTAVACEQLKVEPSDFDSRSAVAGLIGFSAFASAGVAYTLMERAEKGVDAHGWRWLAGVIQAIRGGAGRDGGSDRGGKK